MAQELERFWLIDKDKLDIDDIKKQARKILEIEQAALPALPNEVHMSGTVLTIGSVDIPLTVANYYKIEKGILRGENAFPNDLEIRYRITDAGRQVEKELTIKGNKLIGKGYTRDEVKVGLSDEYIAKLREFGKDYLMIKTRLFIPDGDKSLQFNFYGRPIVSFVMVECEFDTHAQMNDYTLPGPLLKLEPVDMAGGTCFGDKMLAAEPHKAEAQFAEFKKRQYSR